MSVSASWTGDSAFNLDMALQESQSWIEAVTQTKFAVPSDFAASTKDGVLLCRLINQIKPGCVPKIHTTKMSDFKGRENLSFFFKAAKSLGLKDTQLFDSNDLVSGRRLRPVTIALYWLGRAARGIATYKGPHLNLGAFGAKMSCSRCRKAIEDEEPVVTLNQAWHAACAKCDSCSKPISSKEGYMQSADGKQLLCPPCYNGKQANSCQVCGAPRSGPKAGHLSDGRAVCGDCTCADCSTPLTDGYYDVGGDRCCEPCATARQGGAAGSGVPGQDCCKTCQTDLGGKEAVDINGDLYCLGCVCDACNKPLDPATTVVGPTGAKTCPDCACACCAGPVTGQHVTVGPQKVCKPCYDQNGLCSTCGVPVKKGTGTPAGPGGKQTCPDCTCASCSGPIEGAYAPTPDGRKICKPCAEAGRMPAPGSAAAVPAAQSGSASSFGPGAASRATPANVRPAGATCRANDCSAPLRPEDQSGFCPACAHDNTCGVCHKGLDGPVVQVRGNKYHQPCFKCAGCQAPFTGKEKLYLEDGVPLCDKCHKPDTKICAKCHTVCKTGVEALGKAFHSECFGCSKCGKGFPDGNYVEYDGMPFCAPCANATANACAYCQKPLSGQVTEVYGNHYHKGCFKCFRCTTDLDTAYFPFESLPYCKTCIRAVRHDEPCKVCAKPLEGTCFRVRSDGYHENCFKCSSCGGSPTPLQYKFGQIFCTPCFRKKYPQKEIVEQGEATTISFYTGPKEDGFTVDPMTGEKLRRKYGASLKKA